MNTPPQVPSSEVVEATAGEAVTCRPARLHEPALRAVTCSSQWDSTMVHPCTSCPREPRKFSAFSLPDVTFAKKWL